MCVIKKACVRKKIKQKIMLKQICEEKKSEKNCYENDDEKKIVYANKLYKDFVIIFFSLYF